MQTLKSLILKLDGARAGCRCTPQISFPYTRMCHLFRFSFLPWWKCPVQSQGQLQNVWDFILPRVRSGNLGQLLKCSSLSVQHRRGLAEWLSVLPLICETTQSKTTNIHLAFPLQCSKLWLHSLDLYVLWQPASPECYFLTQSQSKFTLHYKSCEKIFESCSALLAPFWSFNRKSRTVLLF